MGYDGVRWWRAPVRSNLAARPASARTMAQQIETLLFDFGGTLDADGVAWKERFHAHYRAEGLDMTAETFAPIFYAADGPLVGDLPLDADLSKTVHRLTANLEAQLARRNGDAAKHHVEDD